MTRTIDEGDARLLSCTSPFMMIFIASKIIPVGRYLFSAHFKTECSYRLPYIYRAPAICHALRLAPVGLFSRRAIYYAGIMSLTIDARAKFEHFFHYIDAAAMRR